jgi:hypothetical protein
MAEFGSPIGGETVLKAMTRVNQSEWTRRTQSGPDDDLAALD